MLLDLFKMDVCYYGTKSIYNFIKCSDFMKLQFLQILTRFYRIRNKILFLPWYFHSTWALSSASAVENLLFYGLRSLCSYSDSSIIALGLIVNDIEFLQRRRFFWSLIWTIHSISESHGCYGHNLWPSDQCWVAESNMLCFSLGMLSCSLPD